MSSIKIDICTDEEAIRECVMACWDATAEDGANKSTWNPDMRSTWLQVLVDGELAGTYELAQWSGSILQVHVNITPSYRGKNSNEIGMAIHKWIVDNADPRFKSCIAFVPECFSVVIKWGEKLGWERQGLIPEGYQRDGKHHGMWVCTFPRDRMKERTS